MAPLADWLKKKGLPVGAKEKEGMFFSYSSYLVLTISQMVLKYALSLGVISPFFNNGRHPLHSLGHRIRKIGEFIRVFL